jgi:hypothetical protein
MLNVTVARNVHWTISVWHVFLDSAMLAVYNVYSLRETIYNN